VKHLSILIALSFLIPYYKRSDIKESSNEPRNKLIPNKLVANLKKIYSKLFI